MLKLFCCLIPNFLSVLFATAQENEKFIVAEVSEATLYLNGAEIRHIENIDLKQGNSKIVINGVSPSLRKNSVQVSVGSNIELVSVSTNEVSMQPGKIDPTINVLQDSVFRIRGKIELIDNQIDAYQVEKVTLAANQSIGGSQTGVSIAELNKMADFFRERTLKINNALTALNLHSHRLQQRLDSTQDELDKRLSKINSIRNQIIILVFSAVDQKSNFTIRYLVNDAGWSASYDLITSDISKPVSLKYKAQIYNNTGIDWKDIALTLSTGDPTASASRPSLTTWTLNYTSGANEGIVDNRTYKGITTTDSAMVIEDVGVDELSISFAIEKKHSIPGNGYPYALDLSTHSLPAEFEYLTIPKVELSAFMVAKVSGWEKLNLIDGIASVYFGNTYIGESRIDTRYMGDTLELSLGRDNQILVSRSKLEDKGGSKFISTKRNESFTYEIQVKNNRKVPIRIKVMDQVPVSQETDIIVEVENISAADLDARSGRLQWIKELQAGESAKYTIAFAVKYPKGKKVDIRKQRVIRTARYRH